MKSMWWKASLRNQLLQLRNQDRIELQPTILFRCSCFVFSACLVFFKSIPCSHSIYWIKTGSGFFDHPSFVRTRSSLLYFIFSPPATSFRQHLNVSEFQQILYAGTVRECTVNASSPLVLFTQRNLISNHSHPAPTTLPLHSLLLLLLSHLIPLSCLLSASTHPHLECVASWLIFGWIVIWG